MASGRPAPRYAPTGVVFVATVMPTASAFGISYGPVAIMIVILIIGIVVDQLFNRANSAIRHRWGLVGTT